MMMTHASRLTDDDLASTLLRLARDERRATATLIVHLGEFDARRLYEGAGYSSMFKYCRAVLRLSEGAAYNRIESARAARRFPAMVDMLGEGSLSPTTARLLSRHLTPGNHAELLEAARWKGRRGVEELLAHRFPKPDVRASIRKLPVPTAAHVPTLSPTMLPVALDPPDHTDARVNPFKGPAGASQTDAGTSARATECRAIVRPLASERYEVRFTATKVLRDKLEAAQDLLGHAIPSGNLAEVVERAVTLLIDDLIRKKFAVTSRPHPRHAQIDGSRYIPAEVRREVWLRDGGRCAFVSKDGHRCGERRFIEFHHVVPYASGGKATADNVQLRCRAHNGHEARVFFGREVRPARVGAV